MNLTFTQTYHYFSRIWTVEAYCDGQPLDRIHFEDRIAMEAWIDNNLYRFSFNGLNLQED